MRHTRSLALALLLAACVPADESLPVGSVEFRFHVREASLLISSSRFNDVDPWDVTVDRTLLSFKTMTIGQIGIPDKCAYRGRGARANVVFDPLHGLAQTFNGIEAGLCPDIGIVLGPPDREVALGENVTVADLSLLDGGRPANALVLATARPGARSRKPDAFYRLELRFDAERSSSTFGGCRRVQRGVEERGVRVVPLERQHETVAFSAAVLLRDAISPTARLRLSPFVDADQTFGNDDHVITMEELDAVPLSYLRTRYTSFYVLPDGQRLGSLGDFVRSQFRFAFEYGDGGFCLGNPPGE